MKRKINVGIRCSRCGKIVPYNFNNFVNVGDEPVCNTFIDGGSTMTTYLNSLKKSNAPEKKIKKETIINDVYVSGCEFFHNNPLSAVEHACNIRGYVKDNGLHIHLNCEDNPNCYYKQLKRTEKEIEELKEDYTELFQRHDDAFKDFNNLKQENLTISYNLGLKEGECAKYKAVLEEIKNYVLDNTDFDKGDDIQSKTAGYDILHKIYEVLK